MMLRARSVVIALAALVSAPLLLTPSAAGNGAPRDLAVAAPDAVGISAERLRRLDAAMKKLADDKQVAGIVTLLERHGKIVDFNAVGQRNVNGGGPLQKDSIFRIYSMTKPVTGVAMMMLYEEGKWRLDDPVSRHIPEFAKLKVYAGKNDDGTPKLEDARRPLTMRELMTHTGGLGYVLNPDRQPVDRMIVDAGLLDGRHTLQQMIDGLAKIPLLAQPGTRWSYSIGVDVQGYLVEKMSGQTFPDFLRTRVFEPLGMKDTAFFVPQEKLARFSEVHAGSGGSLTIDTNRPEATFVPAGASGGGGLYSTAADCARFCEMLLQGGQFNGVRLLAPRTVEMMRTNHVNPEPLKTMPPGTGWGMDFQVITDAAAAGDSVNDGTFTWFGIAGTWFWIDPKADLAFVGMVGHQNLQTTRPIHALSRSLVYQAVMN
jgi:CubicO group peptidase (beta-lactamase class C family)